MIFHRGSWFLLFIFFALLTSASFASKDASPCGTIIYAGGGAGEVAFDVKAHTAKQLTCADCHESRGFATALFEKKRYASAINMRKMELGRSCGKCHPVSMNDMSNCSICHRK